MRHVTIDSQRPTELVKNKSGYGYFRRKINVLNGVQQLDAFGHRALERLAPADQPRSPCTFVDNRGRDRIFEVICTGSAAAVDQPRAAHVAICNLIPCEIDWVVTAKIRVDALVKFSVGGTAIFYCLLP